MINDTNKPKHVILKCTMHVCTYAVPPPHFQAIPSAIHMTDDPLLNTSHTYDGSPVPLRPF